MFSKSSRIDRLTVGSSPTTAIPRLALLAGSLALAFTACAGSSNNSGSGGSNSSGGNSSSGGSSGSGSGGKGSGGSGSGGSQSGGNNAGGSQSGGNNAGGSQSGGTSAKGGSSAGGSAGSSAGGSAGSGNGGSAAGAGGSSAGAGGSAGGAGGGSTSTGNRPPGYYMTKDWSVTSVDWHGCVWTGKDSTVTGSTTSVTPQDFTTGTKDGGPYEIKGTVFNDYNAVSLLGFNLNEAATGDSKQCVYNAAAATKDGPPGVTMPSSATGIAVNWSKSQTGQFRIQIQGVDGATNAAHRWCATIADVSGPSFIKFSDFYTACWYANQTGKDPGAKYDGTTPISAVVFLQPGDGTKTTPFDFTINGFAPGTSAADAPKGGTSTCGTLSGTLGGQATQDSSMARAKVSGTDCKQYVIQNNNWGSPTGSTQSISYTGNSFTVDSSTGSGSSAPASFPSIFIGQNGNTQNGSFSTTDSNLPIQISSITSIKTSFAWSGGSSGGDFNATYDVWFNKSATLPSAAYNDAISGFIMVWLYKPQSKQPIGSVKRQATIAGHSWDVWVGPRGNTSAGTDDSGRPVVSYVAKDSPVSSLSFDLKDFISDAVTNASADQSGGGTSQAFSNSWYLTDVFAGFEIWTGSAASKLTGTLTCEVK